ncbi:MAG: hypothetical protein J0G35_09370 [Acidobacteriales bacterium]|nr:hypothetical protein [Terriglobales bacterium]
MEWRSRFPSFPRAAKDWLRLQLASPRYQKIYLAYWKAKTHLWTVVIAGLLLVTGSILFIFRFRLGAYFLRLDPAVLPQLCIGVGAALIGLIAVVFTLSLFVIQQISDRSVPGILREYAADNITRAIYAALSVLAVTCLVGALVSPKHHPVAAFCLPVFCAVISLVLLSILFVRVAFLSDPSNIVAHIWKTAHAEVKRLRVVQDELVRFNKLKNETDPLGRTVDNIGVTTAALYAKAPFLAKRLKKSLDDLYSLTRHFSAEQQYSLLYESSEAIIHILQQYIEVRGSSLNMANSTTAMMGIGTGWDGVIGTSMETFAALLRTSVETGDTQRAQTLIKPLAKLAKNSVRTMPFNAPPDEHPTVAFIIGYLTIAGKQALGKKNEDVILTLNDQLLPIAGELAVGGSLSTLRWLIEEWSQIATIAVLTRQQTAATDTAEALLKLLAYVIERDDLGHSGLVKTVRNVILNLCRTEVTLAAKGQSLGASMSASPDTPLRLSLSGVSTVSFQSLHSKLVNKIAGSYSEQRHAIWSSAVHMLDELDDGLWMSFEKMGLASAAGQESILFYLNQCAYSIGEQLLWLWQRITTANLPEIDLYAIADGEERVKTAGHIHRREEYPDHLEEMIHWHVIAFYSRCRTLQPATANDLNLRDCFASAVALAKQALGLGLTKLATDTAQTMGRSGTAVLDAGGVGGVVESCRMISVLPELGLVALHENSGEVLTAIEDALKEFIAHANELIKDDLAVFQNWSSPVRLVTEKLDELANGTDRGINGVRLSVWRPTFTRDEATTYLQMLREVLA